MRGAKQKEMFEISDLGRREILHLRSVCPFFTQGGGGGRGSLIISYIRRLGLFFGVQNFEFQYFLGFQKTEFFWGYEDFGDIFFGGGRSSQSWTIFRGHFYAF